ncbi:MAG: tetratricopeptide repeat protein, partial [Silvibacterium sp.]
MQSADAAFRAGHAAMEQNNLALAHTEFAKVVQLVPNVAAGHSALGAVLYAEGNPAAAVAELEQARTIDPKDDAATLNLALSYSQLGSYDKALPLFRQLDTAQTQFSPSDLAAYARALDATGDPETARTKLAQALTQVPNSATLHDAMGTILAEQNKLSDARPEFDRAIALEPNLTSAHLHLGSLLLVQQSYPEAIAEFQKTAALAPNDLQSNLQLGRALAAAGQDDAAVAVLRHARELDPTSIDAKYTLALTLQSAGQTKEAIPLFKDTVAARPS